MKTSEANELPTAALEAMWKNHTCGIVAIGVDGNVRAVNPAFETCTGIVGATILGMGEADLDALLGTLQLERRRVETAGSGLRAVHYLRSAAQPSRDGGGMSNFCEMLREPLAGIYGFAELLLTQNYDEETRRNLAATLLEQAEVMSNLLNQRLDATHYRQEPVLLQASTALARRALIGHQ